MLVFGEMIAVTPQIEQPQIENSNEMHDIHCAIMVFMAEGHIALAGAMNIILFEYI